VSFNDRQEEAKRPPVVHYGIRQVGVCGQRDAWRGKGRLVPGGHYSDGRAAPKMRLFPRSHYASSDPSVVTCEDCKRHPALVTFLEARRLLQEACKEWRKEWKNTMGTVRREVGPDYGGPR
jgi:hypothetical protein